MTAQKGIDMLLEVSADGTSGGSMQVLGGIRASSVSFNSTPIDTTSADDTSRWMQMIAGGIRSCSISGSGLFKDDAAIETLRANIVDATEKLAYLRFIVPDFGTIAANFHMGDIEFGMNHDGEVTFSANFASAGDVSWAAAA